MKCFYIALALLCSFTSCAQYSNEHAQTTYLIDPGSATAHMLDLTREDIAVLSSHHPALIRKIREQTSLDLHDVIDLHSSGVSAESTLQILQYTHSHFKLTSTDIIQLQAEGVPYKVINYLICT